MDSKADFQAFFVSMYLLSIKLIWSDPVFPFTDGQAFVRSVNRQIGCFTIRFLHGRKQTIYSCISENILVLPPAPSDGL